MTAKNICMQGLPGARGTAQSIGVQTVEICRYTLKDGGSYAITCLVTVQAVFGGVLYHANLQIQTSAGKKTGAATTFWAPNIALVVNPGSVLTAVSVGLTVAGADLILSTVGLLNVTIDHMGIIAGLEYVP